jgi:hypothetical protein
MSVMEYPHPRNIECQLDKTSNNISTCHVICASITILTIKMQAYKLATKGTPAGKEAIMSQPRVWPFPFTTIMILGERSRNPDHHFADVYD